MATAPVDAVIVAYRSETTLPESVAALRASSGVRRVVVVDNASPDASATVAERIGCEVVRATENRGFGAGQNLGVRACDAPYVVLLNPDAVLETGAIEAGRDFLEAHPDVGVVQGVIRRAADGAEERWQGPAPGPLDLLARLVRLRERLGEQRLKRLASVAGASHYTDRAVVEAQDVEFIATVAPLVRRAAFEAIGGFDERIFLYAEDVDLCFRLRDAGWRLVALPLEWARHAGGASSTGHEQARQAAFWQGHRHVVEHHWRPPRRWVGLVVTKVGALVTRGSRGTSR